MGRSWVKPIPGTPATRRRRLAELGFTQADLARRWGVAPCTVSLFIDDRFTSARLAELLRRLLSQEVAP